MEESTTERYSMFPIKDVTSYKFYKQQECAVWSANELEFIVDVDDYRKLPINEQRILDIIFSFFLPGDGLITNNIVHRFLTECKTMEEMNMFVAQLYIEMIHAETYGLIFYTLYDSRKIQNLKILADTTPSMKKMFSYIEEWTSSKKSEPERFLAFACSEGIFFSVLFCCIFWFRSQKILSNIILANELISRDETLHRNYGCYLHRKRGGMKVEDAYSIVNGSVIIMDEFIDFLLGDGVRDLTPDGLKQYLRVVADDLLREAGYPTLYDTVNPYPWMNIGSTEKINFFERRGASYTRHSLTDALNYESRTGHSDNISNSAYTEPENVDF